MQIADLVRQFSGSQTLDQKISKDAKGPQRPQARGTDRSVMPVSQLEKGQTFEGNVSSIKGNKVTLALSDGTSLTAKLTADVALTEGESVFFEVRSNDGNLVNIRPISVGMMQNPTILSALSSAGLPENEENVRLVNTMMQEQMPIDSKSLGDMARSLTMHPNANVETLVTMQKVGIPLSDEMIQQFENYKTSEGEILDAVTDLVDGFSESFSSSDVSANDVALFTKNLMSILTTADGVTPQLFDPEGNLILQPKDGEMISSPETAEALEQGSSSFGESILPEDGESAGQTIQSDQADQPDQVMDNIRQVGMDPEVPAEKSALRETGFVVPNGTGEPSEKAAISGQMEENVRIPDGSSGGTVPGDKEGMEVPLLQPDTKASFEKAQGLGEQPDTEGKVLVSGDALPVNAGEEAEPITAHSLDSVLDAGEKEELTSLVKELGVPAESFLDEDGMLRGDVRTQDLAKTVMEWMNKQEEQPSKEQMMKFFSSEPFKEVIKDVMSKRWTIEPEQVSSKGAIKDLYAKLSVDMERLSQVAQEAAKGKNPVSFAAESVKNNVDFINQVNQAYTYIQLPLKLAGQQATGELYVYSNKKRRMNENDELSAFLHFDLDHLGSTDISVKLKNKKVSTNFYMSDDASFDLVKKNMPILQEKLEKLGYSCNLKVSHGQEPVDFVEDFLKQDLPAGTGIRRYSFNAMA